MITPVGILAVNASAFVMVHLQAFRIGIAACALVSGLVLTDPKSAIARGVEQLAQMIAGSTTAGEAKEKKGGFKLGRR